MARPGDPAAAPSTSQATGLADAYTRTDATLAEQYKVTFSIGTSGELTALHAKVNQYPLLQPTPAPAGAGQADA